MSPSQNQSIAAVLPYVNAAADDDIHQSFDKIEREYELERQLAKEREQHQQTRDALQEQTSAVQRVQNERQIESVLREYPNLSAKAVADVTKLILQGDGGPLEQGKDGLLVEKYGTLQLPEFTRDYMKRNPHLMGTGNNAQPAPAALDRATMTALEKGRYIEEHGEEKYFALPCSPDPRQRKK
jgi:hypothetical protein